MSDPASGTVAPDISPEPPPSVAAAPFGLREDGLINPGFVWNNLEVEAQVPGSVRVYVVHDLAQNQRHALCARLVDSSTAARQAAWERLSALNHPRIARCLRAWEDNGWRYELSALPSSMTLREWISCHQGGSQDVEQLIRNLAPAIDALHESGLGHFNINPNSVYFDESDGEPVFLLGGLHAAALIDQPQLITIDVDPYSAPPEAAGLVQHQPGKRLRAWDWWSLGRVVQEVLIGRHVLGLLLDCDVSRATPELRSRAELLLLEREPPGVRAGAVEHMSSDPSNLTLLRGLLTGASDGRWALSELMRWVRREPVREHYELPRTARLWLWKGSPLTLANAAELFTQAANWREGVDLLFNLERPESLACFLRDTPSYREAWERLEGIRQMIKSGGWQTIPEDTRLTVAAALGWLALTNASGPRGAFRVFGQTIDSPGLAELLQTPGGAEGVALFAALLLPTVIDYLETLDSTASRVLKGLATKAGGALSLAQTNGWLDVQDSQEAIRLLQLSLERSVVLQDRHALLRSTYAASRHAELSRILNEKTPTPAELVVSAFTSEVPEKFGYVTHREWRHQKYLELRERADVVMSALLWLRLRQLLRIARLWSAPWQVFVGVSAALAVTAGLLARSVPAAAAVGVSLLSGRVWLVMRARALLRRSQPAVPPWGWRDGLMRAEREAKRVAEQVGADTVSLAAELEKLRAAMLQYPGEPRHTGGTGWWDVGAWFAVGALVSVLAVGQGLLAPRHEVAATTANVAPAQPTAQRVHVEMSEGPDHKAEVVQNPQELLATGRYEVVDDGFGRRLRGPLRPWDHFAPPQVAALEVVARAPAKPEQAAYAVVTASLLLRPYLKNSVAGLLAVRVPTTRGFGVMLFNARDRQLADHDVILVDGPVPLQENSWYALEGRRVLFLSQPLPLDAEISLAPW